MKTDIQTVEDYMVAFPKEVQEIMQNVRNIIREQAPDAVESIAYGMPAYKTFGKPLVYFGGFKKHIGFYATPSGHEQFAEALSQFKQGKGSVQFQLNEPIPYDLIRQIVVFRVQENIKKAGKK